ncbi:MAG: tyrosine-type recombinase/integrase [Paludibacter sp.]|nr:tyrosine-type recombinase/integrase [Paludibacter sp.]
MSIEKDEKRGTWTVRIKVNGKSTMRRGFKTKKEAKTAESIMLKERDHETLAMRLSFAELYELYRIYCKNNLRSSTFKGTFYKLDMHVWPYFKDVRDVNKITLHAIEKWKSMDGFDQYSTAYLKSIYSKFNAMINYGMKYHGVVKNQVAKAGNFKRPDELQKEMNIFTFEEFQRFIAVFEHDDIFKLMFMLLFWTGVRRGEAQALQWRDFSKDFKTVRIAKSYDSHGRVAPTKNKSSIRVIALPKQLIEELEHFHALAKQIDGHRGSNFVFGTVTPVSRTAITNRKNSACKIAGLRQIRVHDFRHSHATYLLTHGADITTVSKRLGHATVTQTLNVYSHVTEHSQDALLGILEQ